MTFLTNYTEPDFAKAESLKHSSEVWKVLTAVKTEFEKFGEMLEKAQRNIQTRLGQLDDLVGVRSRAIKRQLKNVEVLPLIDKQYVLSNIIVDTKPKRNSLKMK